MSDVYLKPLILLAVLTISTSFNHTYRMEKIKIKIAGSHQAFTATLLDNPSAKAFVKIIPLTIRMSELNQNEKYGDLPKAVPINASVPKIIASGDLMMYGSKTLVLFYKSFSTSYSYTKLGKLDDATGLASALGAGDIEVTFEVD